MLNTISTIDLKKMFEDIPRSCRYGYARVSSISPEEKSSLEYQEQEFIKFNIPKENIRFENCNCVLSLNLKKLYFIDDF